MSNLSISDVVHISQLDKGEKLADLDSPDEKFKTKQKEKTHKYAHYSDVHDNSLTKINLFNLNESTNIIFNETS